MISNWGYPCSPSRCLCYTPDAFHKWSFVSPVFFSCACPWNVMSSGIYLNMNMPWNYIVCLFSPLFGGSQAMVSSGSWLQGSLPWPVLTSYIHLPKTSPSIRPSVSTCLRFQSCGYLSRMPGVPKTRCFGQFWHPAYLFQLRPCPPSVSGSWPDSFLRPVLTSHSIQLSLLLIFLATKKGALAALLRGEKSWSIPSWSLDWFIHGLPFLAHLLLSSQGWQDGVVVGAVCLLYVCCLQGPGFTHSCGTQHLLLPSLSSSWWSPSGVGCCVLLLWVAVGCWGCCLLMCCLCGGWHNHQALGHDDLGKVACEMLLGLGCPHLCWV